MNKNTTEKSKGSLIAIIACAVLLLATLGLIVAESFMGGRLTIKNNTDKNISNMLIYVLDEEGYYTQFMDEKGTLAEELCDDEIKAGESFIYDYGKLTFGEGECYMAFEVGFEGEDTLFIDDGIFGGSYTGNMDFEFYQKDDRYFLKFSAGTGLFNNTKVTNTGFTYELLFDESDWEYVD